MRVSVKGSSRIDRRARTSIDKANTLEESKTEGQNGAPRAKIRKTDKVSRPQEAEN